MILTLLDGHVMLPLTGYILQTKKYNV